MTLMTTPALAPAPVPALFLTTAQVTTFVGTQELTRASGFFFEPEDRLYLATQHQPDRLEVDLHLDPQDSTQSVRFSVPLYSGTARFYRRAPDPVVHRSRRWREPAGGGVSIGFS